MIKKIYELLPIPLQAQTRNAWLAEFKNDAKRTFYHRIEHPQPKDYKFFASIWGISIEELMNDITLQTCKKASVKISIIKYAMRIAEHMSDNKQLSIA